MKRFIQYSALALALAINGVAAAEQAPDFTLKALDGTNLRLAEQRGDIMLLGQLVWPLYSGNAAAG